MTVELWRIEPAMPHAVSLDSAIQAVSLDLFDVTTAGSLVVGLAVLRVRQADVGVGHE